ncbi:MAG: hypothetical protein KGO21_01125 [Hyphomicrobiales bacterium]|jgi:hypothetical protein|nr:hypothetical protein [Hyphomicrobiales bacterium]
MVAFSAAMLIVSGPFDEGLATAARGVVLSCDFTGALGFDDDAIDAGRASHSGMGGRKGDAK